MRPRIETTEANNESARLEAQAESVRGECCLVLRCIEKLQRQAEESENSRKIVARMISELEMSTESLHSQTNELLAKEAATEDDLAMARLRQSELLTKFRDIQGRKKGIFEEMNASREAFHSLQEQLEACRVKMAETKRLVVERERTRLSLSSDIRQSNDQLDSLCTDLGLNREELSNGKRMVEEIEAKIEGAKEATQQHEEQHQFLLREIEEMGRKREELYGDIASCTKAKMTQKHDMAVVQSEQKHVSSEYNEKVALTEAVIKAIDQVNEDQDSLEDEIREIVDEKETILNHVVECHIQLEAVAQTIGEIGGARDWGSFGEKTLQMSSSMSSDLPTLQSRKD